MTPTGGAAAEGRNRERKILRIGARGSALARAQTRALAERLRAVHGEWEVEEIVIRTRGDEILERPLHEVGGDKGLFVKEIEDALLEGRVDVAVHSLKDLPGELPAGLSLGAVPEREEPWDVLVSRGGESIRGPPPGSRVGTSSLRRRAQLLRFRSDLRVVDIRGNVDTRLRKLDAGEVDAVVLAAAGLKRLGHADRITERLAPEVMLPAVAQGALGVEVRAGDGVAGRLVGSLEHPETRLAVTAERGVMARLEGGCKVPMAAFAEILGGRLRLRALVASRDGRRVVEGEESGPPEAAAEMALALASRLLDEGGAGILEEIRDV